MTDLASIQYGDTTIEYVVRRSKRRRKTIEISLREDGVHVAAPWRTSDKRLREFVLSRAPWIIERLDEERNRKEQEAALCQRRDAAVFGPQRHLGSQPRRRSRTECEISSLEVPHLDST